MEAYVALGANLGDREASLAEALRRMAAESGMELRKISPIYETAPVGFTDQPPFLNMTACLRTELEPLELLRRLLAIEQEMGRVREVRWGPRNIDLDLLVYGEVSMDMPELMLPHPRMGERAFVLVPLHDIWPDQQAFPWEAELSAFSLEEEGIQRWAVRDRPEFRKEM